MPDLKLTQETLPGGIAFIDAEGFLDAHTFEEMQQLIDTLFDNFESTHEEGVGNRIVLQRRLG